jgi:hypothetical protein
MPTDKIAMNSQNMVAAVVNQHRISGHINSGKKNINESAYHENKLLAPVTENCILFGM